MPPPGYEPFLRAICADPEDDTVRLVYADWLDENGDPDRAEFIRLQVAVPERPKEFDPRYARADELRKAHYETWLRELPALKGIVWDNSFRRGFVESITVQAGKWLHAHCATVFTSTPIQAITLTSAGEGTLAKVLQLPEWERVKRLHLSNCRISPDCFRVLSHCPVLKRLRVLTVTRQIIFGSASRAALTDTEASELAESPHFPALEAIHLSGSLSSTAAALLERRFKTVRYWGRRS